MLNENISSSVWSGGVLFCVWVLVGQDSVLYLLNCPHNVSQEEALIMTQYYT